MVDAPIPNQANYMDAQGYEIDINKIYTQFIQAIDKVRSCYNTVSIRDSSVLVALQNATTIVDARSALTQLCDLNTFPQESRCHAFLRIIGFPASDGSKIYNPGLDIIDDLNGTRTVNDKFKLGIITNQIAGFRELSVTRETYTLTVANIFSAQNSIDAGALSLSSGRNIRQFISPLINSEFDDVAVSNQQYVMDFTSSVGGIPKLLTEYQDIDGNTPQKLGGFKFGHIIKPFIVDPVIDLTVNDPVKLIAIPFVPDKAKLSIKGGNGGYVSRPMLEQVIRDRFSITNPKETAGTADQSVLDYISSVPNITDVDIINKSKDIFKLNEQTQFVKFLNIIRAMIKELVSAQNDIRQAQELYYYVPVPSATGPEDGLTVQGVFLSSKMSSDFVTAADADIINATIRKVINQADASAANAQGIPDVSGSALPNALGLPNVGGSTAPDALGDNNADNLNALTTKRNTALIKANTALRTVEIIMGEFSGLGLCDIVAVLGGLYLMPQASLLGFLDDDALKRMNDAGLSGTASSFSVASNDFISIVKDFYNLMDKIYQDMSQNNGLT
jgi:hypothetical protein